MSKHRREKVASVGGRTLKNGFEVIEELPMIFLDRRYKGHHRMAVFIRDGLHCACCGLKGARLIRSRDKAGYSHIDIYSRDYVLLTVDHIIPRKLGGANHINNYQILCEPCNGRKADKVISVEELRERLFPSRTFPIHAYA